MAHAHRPPSQEDDEEEEEEEEEKSGEEREASGTSVASPPRDVQTLCSDVRDDEHEDDEGEDKNMYVRMPGRRRLRKASPYITTPTPTQLITTPNFYS